MNATVQALFIKPLKKAKPVAVDAVQVKPTGFDGDFHVASGKRQVLMVSSSVLREFGLQPGMLSENIIIDGFDVMTLSAGQALRIGSARFEVTIPCEPCIQMERIRRGLKAALRDRRGMFVKVSIPGDIRTGDIVEFV